MTDRLCPFCDQPMEHQESDPDFGIERGWFCEACDHDELDDYDGPEDGDAWSGGFAPNH